MAVKSGKTLVINTLMSAILFASATLMLLPIYWMIAASFMPDADITTIPAYLFPRQFYLHNYVELFTKSPATRWLFNSVFVSSLTSFLTVFFSAMAGYSFAKKKFVGRDLVFFVMVFTMMIPRQILFVPLFGVVNQLRIFNTYQGLILPALGSTFGVFLMRQFIITLPSEVLESARIDGASELRLFVSIVVPMSKPGLGALAIFSFISSWNDYMWQLLVTSSRRLRTLPLGVATFQEEYYFRYGLMLAGATVAAVPMAAVFLVFQKHFTKGITMGAVKG